MVAVDMPSVEAESIDVSVEQNVLTIRAERRDTVVEGIELIASARQRGVFSRQLILGETLDTENVKASYDGGILTVRMPVAEKAQPRKSEITSGTNNSSRSTPRDPGRTPKPGGSSGDWFSSQRHCAFSARGHQGRGHPSRRSGPRSPRPGDRFTPYCPSRARPGIVLDQDRHLGAQRAPLPTGQLVLSRHE